MFILSKGSINCSSLYFICQAFGVNVMILCHFLVEVCLNRWITDSNEPLEWTDSLKYIRRLKACEKCFSERHSLCFFLNSKENLKRHANKERDAHTCYCSMLCNCVETFLGEVLRLRSILTANEWEKYTDRERFSLERCQKCPIFRRLSFWALYSHFVLFLSHKNMQCFLYGSHRLLHETSAPFSIVIMSFILSKKKTR